MKLTLEKDVKRVLRARGQGALIRRVSGTSFELYWPDGYKAAVSKGTVEELVRKSRVTPEEVI